MSKVAILAKTVQVDTQDLKKHLRRPICSSKGSLGGVMANIQQVEVPGSQGICTDD